MKGRKKKKHLGEITPFFMTIWWVRYKFLDHACWLIFGQLAMYGADQKAYPTLARGT